MRSLGAGRITLLINYFLLISLLPNYAIINLCTLKILDGIGEVSANLTQPLATVWKNFRVRLPILSRMIVTSQGLVTWFVNDFYL